MKHELTVHGYLFNKQHEYLHEFDIAQAGGKIILSHALLNGDYDVEDDGPHTYGPFSDLDGAVQKMIGILMKCEIDQGVYNERTMLKEKELLAFITKAADAQLSSLAIFGDCTKYHSRAEVEFYVEEIGLALMDQSNFPDYLVLNEFIHAN